MDPRHIVLLILMAGFVLFGVGFTFRDYEWGIGLIAVGALGMFGPILYRLIYLMPG